LGKDCPIDENAEEIEYSMIYRIPKIEALENCTKLKVNIILIFMIVLEIGFKKELN
jgi:hypothetical protein